MGQIIPVGKLTRLVKEFKKNMRTIVLAGGCFDVLHPGHVIFLQKAKQAGDILIVLLESDAKIKKLKGVDRPVHTQIERSLVLSALKSVDYIIPLPNLRNEKSYDRIMEKIKPDIIAATYGVENSHHQRSAKLVGARLKYVTKLIGNHSTTGILKR